MHILGADPGKKGGLVVLDEAGGWVASTAMPPADIDLVEFVEKSQASLAILEDVSSSPQQGVKSAFTFGGEFRRLRMAIVAARIPLDEVRPKVWQKGLGLSKPKGASDTAWKNMLKAAAQEIFPEVPITLAVADAALMAEWGRRQGIARQVRVE